MPANTAMEKRLRFAAICLILGLLIETVCLLWTRPLAFVVFAGVGCGFIVIGILSFLYSLVAGHRVVARDDSKDEPARV
jgi:membrane protein implicated in regulation of membrane protease activity